MQAQLILPTHIVIPDTQVKPDVPTVHLSWIGQFIVDEFAGKPHVRLIHLGDHGDMPSLSSYDYGKRVYEGRRYWQDIEAANAGFDELNAPLVAYNARQAALHRTRWSPESKDFLYGNHEDRITRATNSDAKLFGTIGLRDLNYESHGWTTHEFLKPIVLDGVTYAHYFYNTMSGTPYSGMVESRLKTIGTTFTMGHQQTLQYGLRFVNGKSQHGLVAGACYLHDEEYKGPQGNAHWRGIIVKHEVVDGSYDPMFVSLNYLCRRYEGVTLARFMAKKYSGYSLADGKMK